MKSSMRYDTDIPPRAATVPDDLDLTGSVVRFAEGIYNEDANTDRFYVNGGFGARGKEGKVFGVWLNTGNAGFGRREWVEWVLDESELTPSQRSVLAARKAELAQQAAKHARQVAEHRAARAGD